MKKLLFLTAFALLSFLPATLSAQKINVWKGGQMGRANDWNCPLNWSLGIVPDWTCAAIIKQPVFQLERPYPIITKAAGPVQYLVIEAGARLDFGPKGYLEMDLPDDCLIEGEIVKQGQTLGVKLGIVSK